MRSELYFRDESGTKAPVLVWRLGRGWRAISSGPLGGGIGARRWVMNATVPMWYDRDDPDAHLAEIAGELGLAGPGMGLMTGVDVAEVVTATDGGVTVWATVGLGSPMPAAAAPSREAPVRVGTVNVIVSLPVRFSDAALVNAVATVAEAKAQALADLGIRGTGTPTDASCLACPGSGAAEAYGGPRSRYGSALARAAYAALMTGGRRWISEGVAWSDRNVGSQGSASA